MSNGHAIQQTGMLPCGVPPGFYPPYNSVPVPYAVPYVDPYQTHMPWGMIPQYPCYPYPMMSYGMNYPSCGRPLQYLPHMMPQYGVAPAQPMAQQPTQYGASSPIQYGLQHQVNVAELQDGSLTLTAVVNIEPDIEDTQYGGSTAQLQSSDTLLIAKAEIESIPCNVEGMSAVAESITETFPNSETVQAIDGSMSNIQGSVQSYGSSALGTSNVTAQASRGFEPSNVKSSVHDFAIASHRTHAHSEHNMSQLCNDVHESNHETMQLLLLDQHTPLLQQVQDQPNVTLREDHESLLHIWSPGDLDTDLHDGERTEMSDGSDGEKATTTEQSEVTDSLHHYDDVLQRLSTMENHMGSLRTDMQTIVRRMKALEPDLFSSCYPDV